MKKVKETTPRAHRRGPDPLPRTQLDEPMDIDYAADYAEADLQMNLDDQVKPQQVAGPSRTGKSFDWLGWVRLFFFVWFSFSRV